MEDQSTVKNHGKMAHHPVELKNEMVTRLNRIEGQILSM